MRVVLFYKEVEMVLDKKNRSFATDFGFTLVELMTVVAIMGVLLTVAWALFDRSTQEAYKIENKQNIAIINKAVTRAALTLEQSRNSLSAAQVSNFLPGGGLSSLKCQVRGCPANGKYTLVNGVINPAHNH